MMYDVLTMLRVIVTLIILPQSSHSAVSILSMDGVTCSRYAVCFAKES